jgi:hypothetical protein
VTVVVIPPQGDVTLVLEPRRGDAVLDLGRALAAEMVDPTALRRRAVDLEARAAGGDPAVLERLLLARTAEEVRGRPQTVHRTLRVAGAAYRSLAGDDAPVRMALDDVEPRDGSTEQSSTLRWAAGEEAPYTHVLEPALAELEETEVTIVVDRDQQLPAALWLAARLDRSRVRLAGDYAARHWKVLSRMPQLSRAEAGDARPPGTWRVEGLAPGLVEGQRLGWRERHRDPIPEGLWAGRVPLAQLLEPEALAATGCRTVVIGFCAVDADGCLDEDGRWIPRDALARATGELRSLGVRTVAEWWIGAPGIDVPRLETTLAELAAGDLFDWLAGLRTFRWAVSWDGARWAGQVELSSPPPDHDLARSRPFSAPDTLPPRRIGATIEALALRAIELAPLAPARVAAALVASPDRPGAATGELDPDCAVVELPACLDGGAGPATYAANLRLSTLMRIDDRIAALVADGTEGLARLPDRLREGLVAKGILARQNSE